MVNVNKLKGKIVERELSVVKVAEMTGISADTLYRKLKKDKSDFFTIKEATSISRALELDIDEVNAIFFSGFVA